MTGLPKPHLLDVSRLISRIGRGPLTGVDRVELAYLKQFLAITETVYGLAVIGRTVNLFDAAGLQYIHDRIAGDKNWGPPNYFDRLRKRRAEWSGAIRDIKTKATHSCHRFRLGKALKHLPGQMVYFNVGHSNLNETMLSALNGLEGTEIKVLIHDTIPLDFPAMQRPHTVERFREKLAVVGRYADVIICNSQQTRHDVLRYLDQAGRKIELIVAHLGLDIVDPGDQLLPDCIDPTRPHFVCVGTIEPRKNHRLLLEVWDRYWQEQGLNSPQLVIIGQRGWLNEDVFHRLDHLPCDGQNVIELGNVSDTLLAAILKQSKGLLFPSLAEGFGFPPAEAVALGVPVVTLDLSIYGEVLGNNPVYALPNDPYSWRETIIRLMNSKRAESGKGTSKNLADLPNWTDHFNIVLKKPC